MKKAIKKILKCVDENFFFIMGIITIIAAIRQGQSSSAGIFYIIAMTDIILQGSDNNRRKLNKIQEKLDDMSAFHDECELLNVQVLAGLQRIILNKKKENQNE